MPLIPKIRLCLASDCSTLTISETTGVYNAFTNSGGYGSPNLGIGDITYANLQIIAPDGTEYNIDALELGLPSDDPDVSIEIDLSLIDRTSIEDGYWQFIYSVGDSEEDTFTGTIAYYFYCNIECCVSKLLAKIDISTNSLNKINDKNIEQYKLASTFLASLKGAARCFNEDQFNNIKAILNKICRNANCTTCN